ncbi:MAG: hypothetical protein JWM11_4309, partial [Planctomycetaceae bacterium]|nr:hypothetical protein [Planctomycetaceae bacterium]
PVPINQGFPTPEGSQIIEGETLCDPLRGRESSPVSDPGVSLRVCTVPVKTLRSTPG